MVELTLSFGGQIKLKKIVKHTVDIGISYVDIVLSVKHAKITWILYDMWLIWKVAVPRLNSKQHTTISMQQWYNSDGIVTAR